MVEGDGRIVDFVSFATKLKKQPSIFSSNVVSLPGFGCLKTWLGLHDMILGGWLALNNVNDWWNKVVHKNNPHRKAMTWLVMLVVWEI